MQDRHEIIGGEYDIDIHGLGYRHDSNNQLDGVYLYSTGRSALYYILLDIKQKYKIKKILLPDYLCSSVVVSAEKAEMQVQFYELGNSLELEKKSFANIYSNDAAVIIINYFGLQNLSNQVAYIRSLNKDAIIIEDDVQAYYEFLDDLNEVNYKFTSLRKSFACPDGGLVRTQSQMPIVDSPNKFHQYKLAASILKSQRKPEYYDDEVYLHLFEKGENLIDEDIETGMSDISKDIFTKIDTDRLSLIRKRNANYIINGLEAMGLKSILPMSDKSTPLFIPIFLKDRNKVRKYMFQNNVFCPVHWPLDGMNLKRGAEMAEHEFSIIVDHRYTNNDMAFILELLEKSIK